MPNWIGWGVEGIAVNEYLKHGRGLRGTKPPGTAPVLGFWYLARFNDIEQSFSTGKKMPDAYTNLNFPLAPFAATRIPAIARMGHVAPGLEPAEQGQT